MIVPLAQDNGAELVDGRRGGRGVRLRRLGDGAVPTGGDDEVSVHG